MKKTAVVIFVKTPALTPVKTRLAKTIGHERATEIYFDMLEKLKQELHFLPEDFEIFWAVNEGKEAFKYWNDYKCIEQGEGCLGEKQWNVQVQLSADYDHLIFIGADCPSLTYKDILNASSALNESDVIFGPAVDGGYYLIAIKSEIKKIQWTSVEYSESSTLNNLAQNLEQFSIDFLKTKNDIDTFEDLVQSVEFRVDIPQESLGL